VTEFPAPQSAAYGQSANLVFPGGCCRHCGASPSVKAKVRGHRGLIVLMQFRSLDGPFCRDCGIAAVRSMSAQTLWLGWWSGLSLLIAPIVLLMNMALRIRFNGLEPPLRAYGSRPPLDAGRPLYQRFAIVGLVVPLVVSTLFVTALVRDLAAL